MIHGTFEESWRSLSREKIDTIVCVNVLEHMDDDLGVLKTMNRMLSPGGGLYACSCQRCRGCMGR